MTTYIPFTPSLRSAPEFIATLDGAQYRVVVTWNVFGQRYYVNCYSLNGDRIFTVPLLTTPAAIDIQAVAWDILTKRVVVALRAPHALPVGSVAAVAISGCRPATYNGARLVYVTTPTAFTYDLDVDPGASVLAGSASTLISMSAGYFNSTLIFRDRRFEVGP